MISFSGIDCSGKSTQIELLCRELDARHRKYQVVWSRGGYTPGIEWVKKQLRRGKEPSREEHLAQSAAVNANPKQRKLLFLGALMDLWLYYSIVLRVKEWCGTLVICDRYIWDTYIDFCMKYPEYDFEHGFWWKLTLKTMVKPKPSFVLFIPAEESMRRSDLKDEPFPEPIEVRDERIRRYLCEVDRGRWQHTVDAMVSIDEVFAQIREKVSELDGVAGG